MNPVMPRGLSHLIKTAATWGEMGHVLARGTRDSLVGSHGVGQWGSVFKNPIKSIYQGYKQIPLPFLPLQAMGLYSAASKPDAGFFERAGGVVGQMLPMGLNPLHGKGPGFLGSTVIGDALGGGMLVHDGLMSRAGRYVDNMFKSKPRQPSLPHTPNYKPTPPNTVR